MSICILLFFLIHSITSLSNNIQQPIKESRRIVNQPTAPIKDDGESGQSFFEIKATLTECSKFEPFNNSSLEEESTDPSLIDQSRTKYENVEVAAILGNCEKKLFIALKIINEGVTSGLPQYLLVDHAYDSISGKKQKLFKPYLLKIRQMPMIQSYDLTFMETINGGPNEKTIRSSKCNDNSIDALCQQKQQQKASIGTHVAGFCCPNRRQHQQRDKLSSSSSLSSPFHSKRYIKKKSIPDIVHCMEYSKVWYSLYRISQPILQHAITIEIFERNVINNKWKYVWQSITKKQSITIGTSNPEYVSNEDKILVYYRLNCPVKRKFALNWKFHKLLIPDLTKDTDYNAHPEIQGGPAEYLVVTDNEIDTTGKTCNKAGAGSDAFVNQSDKCHREKANGRSCFDLNQPKNLWMHDAKLEENHENGRYFLKYYGCLPENPIECTKPNNQSLSKVLHMYYTEKSTSTITIYFEANQNVMLRPDMLAIVTELYTDNTNKMKTIVTGKVLNSGLVSSTFHVAINNCPMRLPAKFNNINSVPVEIPPQHQHVFVLEILCELPMKMFECTLEVINQNEQVIAIRKMKFVKKDRCICVWHCQCTCYNMDYESLKCNPLDIEQYHAAGFQNGMPIPIEVVNLCRSGCFLSTLFGIFLYLFLAGCYMGIIKAVLGYFFIPIGACGLDKILNLPKRIHRYQEGELRDYKVIYDRNGWPIHPITGKRVQYIPTATQFILNLLFFFLYPLAMAWITCERIVKPKDYPEGNDSMEYLFQCQCDMKDNAKKTDSEKISQLYPVKEKSSRQVKIVVPQDDDDETE